MKITRAKIECFRTLRDVELNFSTDEDRNLTVIRASNETGKTNLYRALGWALFGEDSLPKKGSDFRISTLDWKNTEGENTCKSTVTVWFEEEQNNPSGPEIIKYKILRTTRETLDDTEVGYKRSRKDESVRLWQINPAGDRPVADHKSAIARFFPFGLFDIYFLNGDDALNFISKEIPAGAKKTKVQNVIAEVLNLPVLDKAAGHIEKIEREYNSDIGQLNLIIGGKRDFGKDITIAIDEIDKTTNELKKAEEQIVNLSGEIAKLDGEISKALNVGNKEELVKRKKQIEHNINLIESNQKKSAIEHSKLIEDAALAVELLWDHVFCDAKDKLDEMRNKEEIPTKTRPVLESRKQIGICVCGESLDSEDPEGAKRVAHIDHLIKNSAKADALAIAAGDLHTEAASQRLIVNPNSRESSWSDKYSEIYRSRTDLKKLLKQAGRDLADIDLEISKVPDTNIQELQKKIALLRTKLEDQKEIKTIKSVQISKQKENKSELEKERDKALGRNKKAAKQRARLLITKDICTVLKETQAILRRDVRHSVSDTMNHLFLTMIGAHDEDVGIIERAEVTKDFEILAYATGGHRLVPDIDLNGASRRALTMAFILALCKESGITAPNIIDTPVGMMTAEIKNEFLEQATDISSQLILCLHHDEINGLEELITKKALPEFVYTLTLSSHHPKFLVHDPGTKKISVLRCDCTHLEHDDVCERKLWEPRDGDSELLSQWVLEVQ